MIGPVSLLSQLANTTKDGHARLKAVEAFAGSERQATAVVNFKSKGNLLIIGDRTRALQVVDQIDGVLDCMVLDPAATEIPVEFDVTEGIPCLNGRPAKLAGYLGNFRLSLASPQGMLDTNTASGGLRDHFDLVLDLSATPLNSSALHPLGYYAPGHDKTALGHALEALQDLVGEFEKPKFFVLHADICAHHRSGITACTLCIDACPADAISPAGDHVDVDPNLCQGAGSCATACPTGAIQYNYPSLRDTLQGLRAALGAYREAGGSQPALLFYGSEREQPVVERLADELPEHIIPVEVEETGSIGMDIWLAALAYGAARVYLMLAPDSPVSEIRAVKTQLSFAHALLEGMGYPSDALTLISEIDDGSVLAAFSASEDTLPGNFAPFAALGEKRRTIRYAVGHLFANAPQPRPLISLPAGAPFGDVQVDKIRCTLCMACVSQCPGHALEAGIDVPQLRFIEDNCVQCGMCCRTCPEDAISISPRYLFDTEQRRQRRVVNEDQPFHCISCGKVFGSHRVIEQMSRKLQAHPMFQGAAAQRLKMCEDCRVKDMFNV